MKDSCLIVVDVQNDFLPGGPLGVQEGFNIIPNINKIIPKFNIIFFSQDWHSENHCSFKDCGGLWPKHCIMWTKGAELTSEISVPIDLFEGNELGRNAYRIYKGTTKECYSAFGDDININDILFEHDKNYQEETNNLALFLKEQKIKNVYICGIATDYCVLSTALDSVKNGFNTIVVVDACAGVNEETSNQAIETMKKNGIKIKNINEI